MIAEIRDGLTFEEYTNLREQLGWNKKKKEIFESAIKNSVLVKKAIINNETIGMCRVIGDGIYYLVVDVVVSPKFQKNGIGKQLMDEITNEIKNRTEKGEKSSMILLSMNGKEKFYEKCGFYKVPYEYTGYGMKKDVYND